MSADFNQTPPPGLDYRDVLFALYRHKWKFIILFVLGIVGGAAFYLLSPRSFGSNSKLLVRYVLDRSAVDTVDSQIATSGRGAEGLIAGEVAILTSWDLAMQVAVNVGPDKILEGVPGEHSPVRAAGLIANGLEVLLVKGSSNVISVSFQNNNPSLPQPVLEEFVKRYFDKHLEVHRSMQAFEFVSQQRDVIRVRLNDLDTKLKALRGEAGITSLADSKSTLQSQLTKTGQDLMSAEAELAEQTARVSYLADAGGGASAPAKDQTPVAAVTVPSHTVQDYQLLQQQLDFYHKEELQLLSRYTDDTTEVKLIRSKIKDLETRRVTLEQEHPGLTAAAAKISGPAGRTSDPVSENATLAALRAKTSILQKQLEQLRATVAKVDAVGPQIEDLEAQRQTEQKNLAEFQMKLEKARIDEALDPSKIPNISVVQKPTPAGPVVGKTIKIAAGIPAAGLFLGLVFALGNGLFLDHSIKRPRELESRLHIPMLISIPRMLKPSRALNGSKSDSRELTLRASSGNKPAPWETDHFIRPYAEAIRNRLILGFELKKIIHKPKLIGVTSLSGGEGASTMAGGLAASLSETGDGKVLLVDMNADNPEMRPFLEGAASGSLLDALGAEGAFPSASENLFLATGRSSEKGALTIAPKRFYDLMPVLRSSKFDYIIFDLPPLDQSGATLAVSGFMDKVLLMVEAEKTDRDALKRAYHELLAANADVSTVLNKTDAGLLKLVQG